MRTVFGAFLLVKSRPREANGSSRRETRLGRSIGAATEENLRVVENEEKFATTPQLNWEPE